MRGPGRRVGVLGGTFDPVHIGHLVAALSVRHDLRLDVVLLVVANEPWQKVGSRVLTPPRQRLELVEAAVAGVAGVEASSLEIDRGGTTYTADTIAELRRIEPGADLHLIVGSDVAAELSTWARTDELKAGATLVVVGRPGSTVAVDDLRARGWTVEPASIPALDVSSTEIRARVAAGRPIDFLVPDGVMHGISKRGMYASGR